MCYIELLRYFMYYKCCEFTKLKNFQKCIYVCIYQERMQGEIFGVETPSKNQEKQKNLWHDFLKRIKTKPKQSKKITFYTFIFILLSFILIFQLDFIIKSWNNIILVLKTLKNQHRILIKKNPHKLCI